MPIAAGNFLPFLVFSPDGESIAYGAVGSDGVRRLALRRLDSAEARVIPGTEGAEGPFFSPDGRWIGFWSQWKIRKVRASGAGVPEAICDSLDFRGGTWLGHTIIYTPGHTTVLFKVDESGGQPEKLTKLLSGEPSHRFPHALPDGDTILFSSWLVSFDVDRAKISSVSFSTGKRKEIGTGGHDVHCSPSGHLLYVRAGRLVAAPFDFGKLELAGAAEAILDDVVTHPVRRFLGGPSRVGGHLKTVPSDA